MPSLVENVYENFYQFFFSKDFYEVLHAKKIIIIASFLHCRIWKNIVKWHMILLENTEIYKKWAFTVI